METIAQLNYRPVEECESKGSFVKAIGFKPDRAPWIILACGIAMMIPNNMIVRLLGTFCILMALAVLRFVQDYKVMDIFDQGIMFYGDREARTACFVPFADMKSWTVSHDNGHDTIEIRLNDDGLIVKDTFQADKAYRVLSGLVREKDEKYIRAKEDQKRPLTFRWPWKNKK